MTDSNGRVVSIFGSYSPRPGDPLYESAYRTGYALAEAGYIVCNGGYDGTMEASARGAKDAGGRTIGVTCDVFSDYRGMPLRANPYVDREIRHGDVFSRIREMMALSCGFVILEGGTGTLTEFAIVWEFICKGLAPRRPIVTVGEFWTPVIEAIRTARAKSAAFVTPVDRAENVVAAIRAASG